MKCNGKFQHDCTKFLVKVCKEKYEPKKDEYHNCCMMKQEKKKKKKKDNVPEIFTCYYDIETFQQDKNTNN